MRRPTRLKVVLGFLSVLAVALPVPHAVAEQSLTCPADDGSQQALAPGECRTYGYTMQNMAGFDITASTSIDTDKLVVRNDNNQEVTGSAKQDFLSKYFTVSWDRYPWLTAPDPSDAGRAPTARTGGIDLAVEPLPRAYCSTRPITDGSHCRLGRIHQAGSAALSGQPTDRRTAYLVISFSQSAEGTPQAGWYLSGWTIHEWFTLATSDCPAPEVQGVCTAPVYER